LSTGKAPELDWRAFDVLVVDDEEDNLDAFRFSFRKTFTLHYALGGGVGLDRLDTLDAAVVVSDQRMPGMSGIDFLKRAKERRPDTVGILLTAYADLPVLVEAINSGAVDRYIHKPWDSKELTLVLKQAIRQFATVRDNRRLRDQLAHYAGYLEREQRDPLDYGLLAGQSPAMVEVGRRIEEVAGTSTPVLIEAEPGCEQEVVARAIHIGSPREHAPFVRVTCAAFRGEALERELFGWRRGAFEGAFDDRAGRFEVADRGTLFLDAPEMPAPALQARFLRALDESIAERVGSTDPIPTDARLVVSLPDSIEATWPGLIPELASRLGVFPIRIPPLRERREDIVTLAEHFLRKYARRNARAATSLSSDAKTALLGYDFPGNAHELENVIERAAILARGDEIQAEHLAFGPRHTTARAPAKKPEESTGTAEAASPEGARALDERLDDLERNELLLALARCNGNKAEVARSLGIQRTTLYYRLKRLGIDA